MTPASFFAAAAALNTIDEAVRTARTPQARNASAGAGASAEEALAALLMLRELRDQLAGWETGLIETARAAGASWADLAHPFGVASRQAAERRYLRGTPRNSRHHRRTARTGHPQPARRRPHRQRLGPRPTPPNCANSPARSPPSPTSRPAPGHPWPGSPTPSPTTTLPLLIAPLTDARPHLEANHPDLAARIDTITHHTNQLRQVDGEHR